MQSPYEKYLKMERLTLGLAVVVGIISIIQGNRFIILCSLYILGYSIFCEGVIYLNTNYKDLGIKQFIKAGMVVLLSTILLFKL
ncbi:hypothetical protein FH966_03280 [Lentibacillus cibarius]|uniref:Uncharacterized protein n=1 Tax=Lentibacillus cibarius TaxID=2583219 RepID=A0A549YFZ9_9BACI|nr:hypothetical protein [Lentibacillus cibarius]TMN22043.1 hypothetical protein FFL34_07845 [Lentibacillus cibarius]TRM10820.1 hypothetical protein FH966_03280 [Lentibacillus cibarius]